MIVLCDRRNMLADIRFQWQVSVAGQGGSDEGVVLPDGSCGCRVELAQRGQPPPWSALLLGSV